MTFFHPSFLESQLALSAAIFFLTFAYEDGATILAVTLGLSGRLDPSLGFTSAFLGIWVGDMGLYLVGAKLGERMQQSKWMERFVSWESRAKARSWFERRGTLAVVLSRFIPGSRLPLYVAAGALNHPAQVFASVTGLCAIVWVSAIFAASHYAATFRLGLVRSSVLLAVALVLGPWVAARMRSVVTTTNRMCKTYRRWEFWPAWMFYPPVAAIYAFLSLKHRGALLPTIANPSFRNGGLIGESKVEILRALMSIAPDCVADGYRIPAGPQLQRNENFRRFCREQSIDFPLVLKPNVGQRGAGFKLISCLAEAEQYLAQVKADVILQRYVPDRNEIGVFYYRTPGGQKGEIFAVTEKIFPTLTGDGMSTFQQLLEKDERASLIASTYLRRFPELRGRVIPSRQQIRLVEAGNHCQGCIFRDGSRFISGGLRSRIDEISKRIPGFFIGRYDIRYACEEDLARGRFKIIELNGAASEATNIYDERNSLVSAYRTLYKQWDLVFMIGSANHDRGYRTSSPFDLLNDLRSYVAMSQTYPAAD